MSSDSPNYEYICGACGRSRTKDNIELVAAPDDKYGQIPICTDTPECTIERGTPESGSEQNTSDYRVTETLE